jgi:Ca2+-binding EF-hand superfamily protein
MKRSLLAVAAAVSLVAVTAFAQQTPTPGPAQPGAGPMHGPMGGPMHGPMHGGMRGQGLMSQLDTNKDGKLSKDEVAARFDQVDADKDGFLSAEELAAARAQFAGRHQRMDMDGDAMVSREEAKNSPMLSRNFDAIDANKDGQLSRDEMRSAWAGRGHRHGPRMDANADGLISRDEAKNAPMLSQNFDAIDANKDGSLSRDEMHAWRRLQNPTANAPIKP